MHFASRTQLLTAKLAAAGVAFAVTTASMSGCVSMTPVSQELSSTPDYKRTLLIADTYAEQGHHKRAERLYRQVLRRRPHNELAIAGLSRVTGQAGGPDRMIAQAAPARLPKSVTAPKPAVAAKPPARKSPVTKPPAAKPAAVTVPPVAIAVLADTVVPPPPAEPDALPKVTASVAKPISETPEKTAKLAVDLSGPVEVAAAPAAASTASTPHGKKTSSTAEEGVSRDGWADDYFQVSAVDETGLDRDLNQVIAAAYGLTEADMAPSAIGADFEEPSAVEVLAQSLWQPSTREVSETDVASFDADGWQPATGGGLSDVSKHHAGRIAEAARGLRADAGDAKAWSVMDEFLGCGDEPRQTLAVLTLGELPETCHAGAADRLKQTLLFESNDEVRSAAALALGGLGEAATPAVPVLREIVQTAAQRPADAARVSLMCLGYTE